MYYANIGPKSMLSPRLRLSPLLLGYGTCSYEMVRATSHIRPKSRDREIVSPKEHIEMPSQHTSDIM